MEDGLVTLAIHLGCLVAVLVSCHKRIGRLLREDRHARRFRDRPGRSVDKVAVLDMRVLRTAAVPVLIGAMLGQRYGDWATGLVPLSVLLLVNGVILFLPTLLPQANKDSRSMSMLDSILIGVGAAIGSVPGLSRTGCAISAALIRGVDRYHVLDFALLLTIPALLIVAVFDLIAVIGAKMAVTAMGLLIYVSIAALAFACGYAGIVIMRYLSSKDALLSFCYYSWGMALFTFVLYLMI